VVALTAENAVPLADPADRIAVAERARRRSAVFLWHARLARLGGKRAEALERYRQALDARPVTPGADEPPENFDLIGEAKRYGVKGTPGGAPVPPAMTAGPHWLPTHQPLEGWIVDGKPAVVVVWNGSDPQLARAVERLERRGETRVLSFAGAETDWLRRINPLYTAAQIWIVDAEGMVRLVGRFQPGGDGWEDAVTGAARRISGDE
jgi:hypothetical protein